MYPYIGIWKIMDHLPFSHCQMQKPFFGILYNVCGQGLLGITSSRFLPPLDYRRDTGL
jgi:hypothetical protein